MRGRKGDASRLAGVGAQPFFVQRHWSRRPHFDLYLELEGRLVAWTLPKPPVPDPGVRRFALRTVDRDVSYGRFEGVIPKGEPGEGAVAVWDLGTYEPYLPVGFSAERWLDRGLLKLHFHGERLRGLWELVRWTEAAGAAETWILVKLRDRHAVAGAARDVEDTSALTGRSRAEIERAGAAPTPGLPYGARATAPARAA